MKVLTPVLLVIVAIAGFFMFVKPRYAEIQDLRAQAAQAEDTLSKVKAAQDKNNQLVATLNSLNTADLDRLQKTLPDSIDTLRYLVDLQHLASNYKVSLQGISFQTTGILGNGGAAGSSKTAPASGTKPKSFDSTTIHFSVSLSYRDFIAFMQDLERIMRITDTTAVTFSPSKNGIYDYAVTIKTYWLK